MGVAISALAVGFILLNEILWMTQKRTLKEI